LQEYRTMRCRLLALSSVLLVTVAAARAERLPVKVYGLADGLPSTFVDHIVSDSRGLLWFSTRDGLARFDGSRFVTYGIDNGLPVPQVSFLLESRRGVYWVATNGGGVCRMEGAAVTLTTAAQQTSTPKQSTTLFQCVSLGTDGADLVNVLHEDTSGRIWIGTDGGLFRLDVPTAVRPQPVSINLGTAWGDMRPVGVGVSALMSGDVGEMWVGTGRGLIRLLPDGRPLLYPVPSAAEQPVRDIARGVDGHLWVAYPRGLLRIPANANPDMSHWIVVGEGEIGESALVVSADGHAWVGTDRGVLEFDGRRFRRYHAAHGLPERLVSELAEDRDRNLWIASLAGVMKLSRDGFVTYDEHDGLPAPRIHALFEDANGQVFSVGGNWVISRFDGTRFVSVRPRVPPGRPRWGAQLAFLDRGNRWWILGDTSLGRYPPVRRIEEIDGRPPGRVYSARSGMAGERFLQLFEDARGDVWWSAAGDNGGLGRWDRETERFVTYPDAHGRVPGDRPSAFGEDASGALWVGFSMGGLLRYAGSRFQLLSGDDVPGGAITAIHRDRQGRLWIGSNRDGLTRVDDPAAERPHFARYTTREGLSSSNVRCITSDATDRIYVGTVRGVDRLDPRSGLVRRYTTDDGLVNGFVTAALHDSSDRLWFGTLDGLSRLVTVREQPVAAPSTWIEGWRVNGVAQPVSHLGHASISGIVLKPNQSQVEIAFYGVGLQDAGALRYQYRLEGADSEWSRPSEDRVVHYSRLAPGRYQFQVRVVTVDGVPGPTPAVMQFVILPPLSQRWWFRAGLVLGAILVVFAAHRHRVARLVALERVRMRIAADLHDDIGGSLSRIAIQSEVARRETAALGDQPVRRLVEIAESARGLVDALGDVVWSVDPRRDDLASVFRRIREYADDLLLGSGVRWTYTASQTLDHVKLDPEARRHLFLLLKEAVTNVARHALARSVSLDVELTNRELRAQLHDDGRGFDSSALDREDQADCRGIASMRARAQRLGARLTISSSPETGTKLSLEMPLRAWRRMNMLLSSRLR
jgi:ligand-binding sensor domain-containing protein/signal transduction histidine kinase